jgi:hypothetical protein
MAFTDAFRLAVKDVEVGKLEPFKLVTTELWILLFDDDFFIESDVTWCCDTVVCCMPKLVWLVGELNRLVWLIRIDLLLLLLLDGLGFADLDEEDEVLLLLLLLVFE